VTLQTIHVRSSYQLTRRLNLDGHFARTAVQLAGLCTYQYQREQL
jgi:hypothetical protein